MIDGYMELTKTERLILINQYRILAKLEPESAVDYEELVDVLSRGYVAQYHQFSDSIYNEFSLEECTEVSDILDMYTVLQRAYARLPGLAAASGRESITFLGFSGNDETKQMSYTRFLRAHGRWSDLIVEKNDCNSHFPLLDAYRRMLQVWEKSEKKHEPTEAEALNVLAAWKFTK
jgi:uncharacterized protein YfbU (UPF0304 family)